MKRLVHFSVYQYGAFEFEPASEGQEEEGAFIENEKVVERYVKALEEFEAAHEAVIYEIEPRPCSTCRHFEEKVCDIDKTETMQDKCCNYYHRGFVHEWDS